MAKSDRIKFDNFKITCFYKSKGFLFFHKTKSIELDKNNIQTVAMKKCREKTGLKVVDSERIIIRTTAMPRVLEYYKYKEINCFYEYKAGMRLFCRRNKIPLVDEIE